MKDDKMITANEAHRLADQANFKKSGYVDLINSAIREEVSKGNFEATMLVPDSILDSAAKFLEQHGFRVIVGSAMTGSLVTAAW